MPTYSRRLLSGKQIMDENAGSTPVSRSFNLRERNEECKGGHMFSL